eukprot:scaffold58991_cov27-Tisochrysis_lutea.AAC.5
MRVCTECASVLSRGGAGPAGKREGEEGIWPSRPLFLICPLIFVSTAVRAWRQSSFVLRRSNYH